MKKKILILLTISVSLLLFSCTKEQTVNIFSNGKTDYTIVIPENASEEEQSLAKELAALSDADPEITTDASAESDFEILIGETNRAETASFKDTLSQNETVSAISFIVAEKDGKLVILADDEIGYIYVLDYIKETYMSNGKLTIKGDACDIAQVPWSVYYASDLYYDRLIAEADKDRFDSLKDQMAGTDDKETSVTTVKEAIDGYKKLISSFDSSLFGEYSSTYFTLKDKYDAPTVYPGESHPRILFTENSIGDVRKNLTADQNAIAYKKYIALSNVSCDGKFVTLTGNIKHNFDYDILAKIETKAFRFIMERDAEKYPDKDYDPASIFGYEAIYALKNAMLTLELPETIQDVSRTYGQIMYIGACVYDWCYELLTEEDKAQLLRGSVNLIGKHMEIVRYDGSGNFAPTAQNPAYDHGAEYQLLQGYLSFAIACYDEAPEIYELCAGRVLNDYVDMQNFLYQSGSHNEGSTYAPYRAGASLMANILINKMSDGKELPFKHLDTLATTMTYYFRPDEQVMAIGDFGGSTYNFYYANYMFYASSLYDDSYFKSFAYKYSSGFTNFSIDDCGVSSVKFLALNDPERSYVYEGSAPLTNTTSYPLTNIFAKSANNDPNAFTVYMTMPETYAFAHSHADCGSFQIFYKGILASNSGAYGGDAAHQGGYNKQTISSNSILVYNDSLKGTFNSVAPTLAYCGGQSIKTLSYNEFPKNLEEIISLKTTNPRYYQCTSLGKANVETPAYAENAAKYLYSYMGGDMTMAYDQETVDEVTRYMFAVATDDKDCPLVFITFDRITSDSADYKKTALIHVQEAPYITDDGKFVIVTNTKNGNSGKMIVQNVGFDTEYNIVGGEGEEFMVNGVNLSHNLSVGPYDEYGWGRIEISPEVAEKTNHILTVMYVTDATNNAAPKAATEIVSENLAGAEMFGKTVLFSKNEKLLTEASSFTINTAGECFIAGVSAGTWTITGGGETKQVTVADGTNLITFNAQAGNYTIARVN